MTKILIFTCRAHYTRRKFRVIYAKVMKRSHHVHRNSASFIRYYGNANLTLSLLAESLPMSTKDFPLFDYPFNELLVRYKSSVFINMNNNYIISHYIK